MTKPHHLSRREFVTLSVGVLGTIIAGFIGLPAIAYLISPAIKSQKTEAWVSLGPLENYLVGEPTLFTFTRTTINGWEKTVNSYGVYVYRKSEAADDLVVLSNVCTHLSCRVTWFNDVKEYDCPCHDAAFDIEGQVLSGPPPRPLDRYEHKIEEDNLFILVQEA